MERLLVLLASPEDLLESRNGGLIFSLLTMIMPGLMVWPVSLLVLVNVQMDYVILPVVMVVDSVIFAVASLYNMAKRAVRYLLFGSSSTTNDDGDLDDVLDANDEGINNDDDDDGDNYNDNSIINISSNSSRTLGGLFGNGGSSKRFYNSRNRQLFAYQRHIERSLRQRDFESIRWEENAVTTNNNDTADDNDNGDTSNIKNSNSNKIVAQQARCCSICLQESKSSDNDKNSDDGDTIVSVLTDCCKSNIFHKRCIMAWLHEYSNDSCPCCRTPMLPNSMHEGAHNSDAGVDIDIEAEDAAYEAHVRLQLRKRMEIATRRQNDVIAIFLEQQERQEEQRTRRLMSSVD